MAKHHFVLRKLTAEEAQKKKAAFEILEATNITITKQPDGTFTLECDFAD
jgi:hypothetical protein